MNEKEASQNTAADNKSASDPAEAAAKFTLPARKSIARLPTPIHHMQNVSRELGVDVYVKRDDLTGFQLSGNKIRKLNYLISDAEAQGCGALVTWGGVQSNHCRATAALAAMRGLECVLVLRGEDPETWSSNHLLHRMYAATPLFVTKEQFENKPETRAALESQFRARGVKPYYIPEGGDCPLGAMGYLEAWREIAGQLGKYDEYGEADVPAGFDAIITAVGTGGTQAGLILGRLLDNLSEKSGLQETKIFGVNVCYDKDQSFQRIKNTLWTTIQQYGLPLAFLGDDITILDGFLGEGYAVSTEPELKFIYNVAKKDGILLDPVYSAKAFIGMYETIKRNKSAFGERVLFLHTGGGFGLFQDDLPWKKVIQS